MSTRSALRCTVAFFAALLLSVSANAQLFRAYLAPTGVDTNPCNLAAPCRLLPAAIAAVANGGEIWMLDSANYNTATVSIGKSVSILAVPGAVGSILAIGGPAITIAASGLKVALRNVVIVPLAGGGGTDGISMTGASTLNIEDSLIANLSGIGVDVSGAATVKIATSIFRNNADYAVYAANGPSISVSGTKFFQNYAGVHLDSGTATTTTAVVSDSIISGGTEGVAANSGNAAGSVRVVVTRSTIDGVEYGLISQSFNGSSALLTLSGSTITNTTAYAWSQSGTGSVIESAGNNHIRGNTSTFGTLTPVGLQ